MKKVLKRTMAIFLTLAIMLTTASFMVFAKQSDLQKNNVETQLEFSGNGSVGNLISDTIQAAQGNSKVSLATITDVKFSNYIAEVIFSTSCSANLVIAIYSEDGKRMFTSGISKVSSKDTSTEVEVEPFSLPEYFLIKVFLLSLSDNSALCEPYICYNYTKAFEIFMTQTTNDFEQEYIINFDSSENYNFGVIDNTATIVEESTTNNTFISYEPNSGSYVFSNIDNEIKNLKKGDIFYRKSDNLEEIILIKVKSISVSNNQATIVEDSASITDFFEYLKLDASKIQEDEVSVQNEPWIDIGSPYTFESKNTILNTTTDSTTVTGSVTLGATLDFKLYIADNIFTNDFDDNEVYIRFKVTPSATITLTTSSELKYNYNLPTLTASLYKIVKIAVKSTLVLKITGKITLTGIYTFSVGAQWHSKTGFSNLSENPIFKPQVKIEGTYYIGIQIEPMVYVLKEDILKLGLLGEAGVTIEVKLKLDDEKTSHSCEICFDGNITGSYSASVNLVFTKGVPILETEISRTLISDTGIPIATFYYSATHDQFGWGKCPFKEETLTFGSYPQSRVTDTATLAALNIISKKWVSYEYFIGLGGYGDMYPENYMYYADVTYDGHKYRGVQFTQYRSLSTMVPPSAEYSYQYYNGYQTNNIYWFKYEPLEWNVIDYESGYMICKTAIDSQPFNNYVFHGYSEDGYKNSIYSDPNWTNYANDYSTSSIRNWLNNDFYNTAFSDNEKTKIAAGSDKVLLPSLSDVTNTGYAYDRTCIGTDYAKCQGLGYSESTSNCGWLLRTPSPGDVYNFVYCVDTNGNTSDYSIPCEVGFTALGIRPTIYITDSSIMLASDSAEKFKLDSNFSSEINNISENNEVSVKLSYSNAVVNCSYILLNVVDYSSDFVLSPENLVYIDFLTADENGQISAEFIQKEQAEKSVYILVGDFGDGIKTKFSSNPQNWATVTSIRIVSPPNETTFVYNKDTSLEGLKVTAVYSDKTEVDITDLVQINGYDTSVRGNRIATVSYIDVDNQEYTTEFDYTVKFNFIQWILYIICFGWIWM